MVVLILDPDDYQGSASFITFVSGSTTGDREYVNIVIVDDDFKELNESFVFAICAGGDASAHIDDFSANVYIVDEESKIPVFSQLLFYVLPSITVVQFSLSVGNAGVVDEDNGVKVVTVSLTGDLKRDVAVKIATMAGTGLLCT